MFKWNWVEAASASWSRCIKIKIRSKWMKAIKNVWSIFFKKYSTTSVYFRPFRNTRKNRYSSTFHFKWKKRRWFVWDLNLGPQDGRRRRIHWAMPAPNLEHFLCCKETKSKSHWARSGSAWPDLEKKILVGILYWANLEPTLALLKCNWQIFVALNGQILKKSCHPVTLIWIVLKTCVASHLTWIHLSWFHDTSGPGSDVINGL